MKESQALEGFAWQEQQTLLPMGKNVLSNFKTFSLILLCNAAAVQSLH